MTSERIVPRLALVALFVACARAVALTLRRLAAEREPWTFGDWSINYGGGFARRGLSGVALGATHDALGVSRADAFLVINAFLCALCAACLVRKYASQDGLGILYLLLPSSLILVVWDPGILGRKELLITAYACLLAALPASEAPRTPRAWFWHSLVFGLFVLVHESMAFFVPLIVIADALGHASGRLLPTRAMLARIAAASSLPALVLVALALLRRPVDESALFSSLGVDGVPLLDACLKSRALVEPSAWIRGGSICYLNTPLARSLEHVWVHAELPPSQLARAVAHGLAIGAAAVLPFLFLTAEPPTRRRAALWLAVGIGATVPLYVLAIDWGRWLFTSTLILAAHLPSRGARPQRLRLPTWAFALVALALASIKGSHGREPALYPSVMGPRAALHHVKAMLASGR